MRIILFFLFLLSAGRLAATGPVIGTTTFNNAFSAQGNILPTTASPATVTDIGNTSEPTGILPTGWNFTITAPASTVTMSAAAVGANPGGAMDFCIRMNATTVGVSVQSTAVKSNDGSAFSLQSVFLKLNITVGAPANMTITGYRSGVAVPSATLTVNSIATAVWTQFNVSAIAAFGNVDEFRFTQTGTSATISFEVIDQITIAAPIILPLTLLDFSGLRADNKVNLQWTTASEQNTSTFEIQRGNNGSDLTTVGRVSAAGNSSQPLHYQFTDAPPVSSAAWLYRLKMIDLDGRYTYSPVLNISPQASTHSLSAYPNPFRQQATIVIQSPAPDKLHLTIADMSGKTILSEDLSIQQGNTILSLPSAGRLPKGTYLLSATTSRQKQTLQIVKLE